MRVRFEPTGLRDQTGQRTEIKALNGSAVFLMSGIGNPEAFMKTCELAGLKTVGVQWFPDHHHFTDKDLSDIKNKAQNKIIITTEKDFVRLKGSIAKEQLFYLPIRSSFLSGSDNFDKTIINYVGTSTRNR